MNTFSRFSPLVPSWIVWLQGVCFLVLYTVWGLPETILIRHISLIIGASLSLWVFYQYRHVFLQRSAIPVWLIVGLFAWSTFHLFFLSADFTQQYAEYTSIWKRTAIGAIFALGFGISLVNQHMSEKHQRILWALIYFGLIAPTLIYIFKFLLTNKIIQWDIIANDYWLLYSGSAPFYIPKTYYVCFCLPTFGIALGQIVRNVYLGHPWKFNNFIYAATALAVLFVFYAENIRNGFLYGTILFSLFICALIFHRFREKWIAKLALISIVLIIGTYYVNYSIKNSSSWHTFLADVKVARDIETHQHWKYNGNLPYPNNELGFKVSASTYERIAWGLVGIQLIMQNPFGYGLIERSFGGLAKINWPDSNLHQSHSGWIDLTLGLGLPIFLLIILGLLIIMCRLGRQLKNSEEDKINAGIFKIIVWCSLLSLVLMWFTSELSQKVYFDTLIFWLAFGAGMVLIKPLAKS